jgi:hypothetical protein
VDTAMARRRGSSSQVAALASKVGMVSSIAYGARDQAWFLIS